MYIQNKFYNLRTEVGESINASNSSLNKILKKKKLITESNEPFKDMSNEHMKFQKSFVLKNQAEKFVQANKKEFKEKALLKKSSKLKIKKFPNENWEKSFKYGKLFR